MKAAIAVLIMLIAASVFPAMAAGDLSLNNIPGYENSRALAGGADTKRIEDKMAEALNDLVSQKQAATKKKEMPGIISSNPSELESNSTELPSPSLNSSGQNRFAANSSAIKSPVANLSAINASAVNSSATNSSTINSSALNTSSANSSILSSPASDPPAEDEAKSASGESDGKTSSEGALAQNSSMNPQGIESNSKTNFKGYYGITASQHEMGKNDINSKTFLSGTFSMDKSVKFQDIGV